MEITLQPSTAQRIRAALGEDLDLAPERIPSVLARLAVEAPSVYSEVLAEISGSQIRLDSERELQRRWRSGWLRRALFWWGEYESDAGDRVLAKRHIAAAVPLGMAGVILVLLVLSAMLTHHTAPPRDHAAAAARGAPAFKAHPKKTGGVAARPGRQARSGDAARSIVPPIPDLPIPDPPASPPAPMLPASAGVGLPGNPVVINLPDPAADAAGVGLRQAGTAQMSPIVYDRAAEEAGPRPGAADQPAHPAGAGTAGSARPWVPGRRVPARLATGVVLVSGEPPVPVIAESQEPPGTWLGYATVGPEGLIQITFALAPAGGSGTVRGVALDARRLAPGLLGSTALRQPRAASALLSAALQATADYMQALAQQGQTTVADGWAQLTVGQAAPAWTYVTSRLAQGLEPRAGTASPVETTEIAAGTPFVILVTEAP